MKRRIGLILAGGALLCAATGCFSERTFEADLSRIVHVNSPKDVRTVREWAVAAERELRPLLPAHHKPPLTTNELTAADQKPIDVYRHFSTDPNALASVFRNFYGMMHTAQCSHTTVPSHDPPPWPGFEDVWIPVADGVRVFGRLGFARENGRPALADCIVVLPGLLGDLSVERTRTIANALVKSGLHVLAIELRGYGRTDAEQPNVYYNFGVLETGDLLAIAQWLQAKPEVRRTGLIGFCWGANHALLAAWDDGRADEHVSVSPHLAPFLRRAKGTRCYEAGVIAFSPVLVFEEIVERSKTPTSAWVDPVLNTLQDGTRDRKLAKGHTPADGNLRTLIDAEFACSPVNYPGAVEDGLDYLRFMPFRGRTGGDKLESARVPVLIVHASTDPLASAQAVADLMATTKNPNVAAIVLEGGGHVGFAAYAKDWFYSLILGFFDQQNGAGSRGRLRDVRVSHAERQRLPARRADRQCRLSGGRRRD
ncbi:MAG: alpha/beta fold hydrolase [Planctomycetes bacterium]|nr:alpha/beta fold hydrolase [Planctomycetota bacterium]